MIETLTDVRRDPTSEQQAARSKSMSELTPYRHLTLEAFRDRFGAAFLVYYSIAAAGAEPGLFTAQTADSDSAGPLSENKSELRWLAVRSSGRSVFRSFISAGRALNNDIVLDHVSVSKLHAVFRLDDRDRLLLHDARSRNGTFVNDARVDSDAAHAREVLSGAQIRFGSLPMILFDAEAMLAMVGRQ
jgi:hypothetical protein